MLKGMLLDACFLCQHTGEVECMRVEVFVYECDALKVLLLLPLIKSLLYNLNVNFLI